MGSSAIHTLLSLPKQAWWLIAILAGLMLLGGGGKSKKKKKSDSNGGTLAVVVVLGFLLVAAGAGGGVTKIVKHHGPHIASISASAGEVQWIDALLTSVGAPHSGANVASIEHWIRHETVGWPPRDTGPVVNNPLNTSEGCCGGSAINSAGVMAYPTLPDGLQATVITLENGNYGDILSRLRHGVGLRSGASAGLRTWSNGAYGSV